MTSKIFIVFAAVHLWAVSPAAHALPFTNASTNAYVNGVLDSDNVNDPTVSLARAVASTPGGGIAILNLSAQNNYITRGLYFLQGSAAPGDELRVSGFAGQGERITNTGSVARRYTLSYRLDKGQLYIDPSAVNEGSAFAYMAYGLYLQRSDGSLTLPILLARTISVRAGAGDTSYTYELNSSGGALANEQISQGFAVPDDSGLAWDDSYFTFEIGEIAAGDYLDIGMSLFASAGSSFSGSTVIFGEFDPRFGADSPFEVSDPRLGIFFTDVAAVPEPASLSLVALGILALTTRRRFMERSPM